jgi:hypothetical protein
MTINDFVDSENVSLSKEILWIKQEVYNDVKNDYIYCVLVKIKKFKLNQKD